MTELVTMMEIDLSVLAVNALVQLFSGWLHFVPCCERWLWLRASGSSITGMVVVLVLVVAVALLLLG